ncbi:cell division protein FtsB [Metallibacterium sp.]|jgi:cell division protein FtsB|uniref:cell division protein FtsB n=1 Tax=Metallibacterium sp. TaxID=2940281 RepID=UPI00260A3E9B|nr:cell division protein FtsB [Metallibacterium sp.]
MWRWLSLLLLVLVVFLQSRLWWGPGSMQEVRALRAQVQAQTADNARLRKRNELLEAEVADLKTGTHAIEAHARSELGLIKPGEVFYQVVPVQHPAGASSAGP